MAREEYDAEIGFSISEENGDKLVSILSGTAIPDGLGKQAEVPIGSLYVRSGAGKLYHKVTNTGAAIDWELNGGTSVGGADTNTEITRSGILVTAIEVFNSPTKLVSERRMRQEITYSGIQATQIDTFYYASDGVTIERQVRDTFTYSGILLTDTRTVEI
jgi:hypothetical protein